MISKYLRATALLAFTCATALAYEPETHEQLTKTALAMSKLGSDGTVLKDLGLLSLGNAKQIFPDGEGANRVRSDLTAERLVIFGSNAEDEDFGAPLFRSKHHFYDPIHNIPLIDPFASATQKSPDWALEDLQQFPDQMYSYHDAREYLFQALTKADKTERDRNWGMLFRTLGQVVHHLQDMAQPQHVRNDSHIPLPYLHSSRYEKYTLGKTQQRTLGPFSGYPTVSFTDPRQFWFTGSGKGIAEFTNRNFVSARTNFLYKNDAAISQRPYIAPLSNGPSDSISLADLLDARNETAFGTYLCTHLLSDPKIGSSGNTGCNIQFYSTTVTDSYAGEPNPENRRASSLSVFDQYLKRFNKSYSTTISLSGISVDVDRLFTLNEFNFDAAYPYLLPRAVAYGAGLIDYFFRGRLEISPSDAGIYAVVDHSATNAATDGFRKIRMKLRNATPDITVPGGSTMPQEMPAGGKLLLIAKFRRQPCYQPDLSGEPSVNTSIPSGCSINDFKRKGTPEIVQSAPFVLTSTLKRDAPDDFEFVFDSPIPLAAADLQLQAIYRGPLGAEQDGIAVATQDVSEPTYVVFSANFDQLFVDGAFYTPDQIRDEVRQCTAIGKEFDPDCAQVPENERSSDYSLIPPALDLSIKSQGVTLTQTVTLQPAQYIRLALITGMEGAGLSITSKLSNKNTSDTVSENYPAATNQLNYEPFPPAPVCSSVCPPFRKFRSGGGAGGFYSSNQLAYYTKIHGPLATFDQIGDLPPPPESSPANAGLSAPWTQ